MEYELKHYYRVKYALVCARQRFLKNPSKDEYEEYARKVIGRAYFLVLNKIDELDGTNDKLLEYYRENIEKHPKVNNTPNLNHYSSIGVLFVFKKLYRKRLFTPFLIFCNRTAISGILQNLCEI